MRMFCWSFGRPAGDPRERPRRAERRRRARGREGRRELAALQVRRRRQRPERRPPRELHRQLPRPRGPRPRPRRLHGGDGRADHLREGRGRLIFYRSRRLDFLRTIPKYQLGPKAAAGSKQQLAFQVPVTRLVPQVPVGAQSTSNSVQPQVILWPLRISWGAKYQLERQVRVFGCINEQIFEY